MADLLHIDVDTVDKVAKLWKNGEVVAIPTETVYGLSADATNGEAVARIYALKSRPQFNPLIVHVADVETAQRYVEWNETADVLAKRFWPGPLTLVLKRKGSGIGGQGSVIHDLVSAGGDTLAIRIPNHPVALQLLRAFGGGIAAPSANHSGRVSPTTAAHVRAEFGDALPLIVDGGACKVGLESTVLDLANTPPTILRPGAVTREMVEEVTSDRWPVPGKKIAGGMRDREAGVSSPSGGRPGWGLVTDRPLHTSPHPDPLPEGEGAQVAPPSPILKSPGQLESHYAPSIPVRLNATEVTEDEALLAFGSRPLTGAAATKNLSPRGDVIEAAANLFAHLRALDAPHHRAIAVMPIPNEGIGEAINDRLRRASVGR